jgi:hypothetical protein
VSTYFHPEFGYFCPTPRLRRELRIACYAGLFGVALGAASIIALGIANVPSPTPPAATQPGARDALPRQLAKTERNDAARLPESEAAQGTPSRPYQLQSNRGKAPRSWGAIRAPSRANQMENGPELARIPLGRPENAALPSAEASSATPAAQVPATSSAAPAAGSTTPRAQGAAPEAPPRAAPAFDPKPHRAARAQSRPPKQEYEPVRVPSSSGNGLGTFERAYARTAFPRTVFWDWSR